MKRLAVNLDRLRGVRFSGQGGQTRFFIGRFGGGLVFIGCGRRLVGLCHNTHRGEAKAQKRERRQYKASGEVSKGC
jgi:hypothetical protein